MTNALIQGNPQGCTAGGIIMFLLHLSRPSWTSSSSQGFKEPQPHEGRSWKTIKLLQLANNYHGGSILYFISFDLGIEITNPINMMLVKASQLIAAVTI